MSEAKFTKGPWHYQEEADVYTHIVRDPSGHGIIVSAPQGVSLEIEANARLCAAAPEMYEALEGTAEALAVALGRLGVCGEGDAKDHRADAESFGGSRALGLARTALAKADGAQ